MANELATSSAELAAVVERAAGSVAAVHARPRFSSSAAFWRPGILVTAEHTVRREERGGASRSLTVTIGERPRRS